MKSIIKYFRCLIGPHKWGWGNHPNRGGFVCKSCTFCKKVWVGCNRHKMHEYVFDENYLVINDLRVFCNRKGCEFVAIMNLPDKIVEKIRTR
jgi:hypothetical protein